LNIGLIKPEAGIILRGMEEQSLQQDQNKNDLLQQAGKPVPEVTEFSKNITSALQTTDTKI
jgi:hypothetical protein